MLCYVVVDMYTFVPLGVFESIDLAKAGSSALKNSKIIILEYEMNKECTRAFNNVYQTSNN